MSDIVERLRGIRDGSGSVVDFALKDAIAEIERLRAEIFDLKIERDAQTGKLEQVLREDIDGERLPLHSPPGST